jgi:hypothetical protein
LVVIQGSLNNLGVDRIIMLVSVSIFPLSNYKGIYTQTKEHIEG